MDKLHQQGVGRAVPVAEATTATHRNVDFGVRNVSFGIPHSEFRIRLAVVLSGIALLLASMVLMSVAQTHTLNVSLILSDSSSPYRQFADSFNSALVASNADMHIVELPLNGSVDALRSSSLPGTGKADLIVAVGTKAAELSVAQIDTPVLVVMVPEAAYQKLLAQKSLPTISAIYLNQSWDRQLDFLRAALPERRKVGLLYSPDTRIDIENLRKKIVARGGSLIARSVQSADSLFFSLESVLADSAVLLAIPDNAIYNNSNFLNILLTSYRHKVPLVGISKAYVNAGALCAIFSTPEQLAGQAGKTVVSFSRDGQLPAPQYPAVFTIEVNQQVARSLEIELPSQDEIRGKINRGAGR